MLFLCLFVHLLSQYRCIFAIIICSISYYNQPTSSSPPALFFHLPSILTTEHNTHSHYTNGDEHHSVGPSLAHGEDVSSDGAPLMSPPSPPPSSPAAPMPEAGLLQLPPAALFILGHLAVLAILRFVFIVWSILNLCWPRSLDSSRTSDSDEETVALELRNIEEATIAAPDASAVESGPSVSLCNVAYAVVGDVMQGIDSVAEELALGAVLIANQEQGVATHLASPALSLKPEGFDHSVTVFS
jgi:hypothetical protein